MDDEQVAFWYSGGASVKAKKAQPAGVIPYDKSLSWAENVERFKQASARANNGKNR